MMTVDNRVTRWTRAALLAAVLGGSVAVDASAKPGPAGRRRSFDLFAGTFALFNINRFACGLTSSGAICTDPGGSPLGGGGFWPKGTPDGYVFGSGLQAAGIISTAAGFAWAGDTVGAMFYDPSTGPLHGRGLTGIYNSLDPADAAAWPVGAVVRDTALYNSVLIGQNVVAQQDLWWRTWDGDPALLTGRKHPMGILVETRAMGWNYPAGNQDIQYLIFTFYNISASDPARYNGIDPAIRGEIAAIGAQFASTMQSRLAVSIPAAGYKIDSLYVAFATDMDVGPAAVDNYASAILPFSLGMTYIDDFDEPAFTYPSDVFSPPFAAAPGFAATKYLRSPVNPATGQQVGLTMFSNTQNPNTCVSGLCDAQNVIQLWRYLSGNINPAAGDNPCTVANPKQAKVCFLGQTSADMRFFQSSGPFSLDAGQSATVVLAYVLAPPVASAINPGADHPPGIPATGAEIAANPAAVRFLERAAGWVGYTDNSPADGVITQNEVQTVPASLLQKSNVAQSLFDSKFLLPFAPTAPDFYLVPGDNRVTLVWQPSVTETVGDPFFSIASNSTSPFYDPNFRRFDVEGYRVYRGRTSGNLELIAQFDYSNTTFPDRTGSFDYGSACAPELGLVATPGCPVAFDTVNFTVANPVPLTGDVVQVPRPPVAAGRVRLQNLSVLVLQADTAVTGGGSGYDPLDDSGVPFAMVDTTVRNSFTYFYAVTAFDLNSLKSGPTSLESARITKSVTVRKGSTNVENAVLISGIFGDDGVKLDPGADFGINSSTGRFTGAPPPTNALAAAFAPLVPQLLPALKLTATIDSVLPRNSGTSCGASGEFANIQGICHEFFVTFDKDGVKTSSSQLVLWSTLGSAFGEPNVTEVGMGEVKVTADQTSSVRFGIPSGFSSFTATVTATLRKDNEFSAHENQGGRRILGNISPGGSRWFTGANETLDHPTIGVRVGSLPGVDTIFSPLSHIDNDPAIPGIQNYTPNFNATESLGNALNTNMQCHRYAVAAYGRQADVEVTWGAGGALTSVRDVTHHLNVPFKPSAQSSYGFFVDANSNGMIDWRDFDRVDGVKQQIDNIGFCGLTGATAGAPSAGAPVRSLVNTATLTPVSVAGASPTASEAGFVTTGNGFGMYLNGHVFIFQMTALPAAGTKWTLRSYAGMVTATSGPETATPSGYTYSPAPRSPAISGLRVQFNVAAATTLASETDSTLDKVHTVPDPYYVTNALEATTNRKILRFINLPDRAIIRIYSVSGVLVNIITHNDQTGGGETSWNLRNRNNQFVASGVYFYHIETPSGREKIGRFTVVNFAQ